MAGILVKINNYTLEPLSTRELEVYINSNGCVSAITTCKLEYLGLVINGKVNDYGYVSWAVPKELIQVLYSLMSGTFKGDWESKHFAWEFFYRCALSAEYAKECYDRFRNPV